MGAGIPTPQHFKDDDPFLLKYLPGNAAYLRALRARIYGLNTENLNLVRFVLLVGPTGTGKNHLARVCAGHLRWVQLLKATDQLNPSQQFSGKIAPLEDYLDLFGEKMLPAIPEGLVESELFGHVRGAFSGAVKDNPGLFRDEGYQDILLDEIGEAPAFLQAKLLAVLEGRPFTPVGGGSQHKQTCDKRIFMATNRNLEEMIASDEFREDLFFRIRRRTISLPPLSANPELIPEIATAILDRLAPKKFKDNATPSLSSTDTRWLQTQRWAGNVRELEEVIELWLADGCTGSIEAVAATRHFGNQVTNGGPQSSGNVTAAVRAKIQQIISDQRPSPGSIQKFIESFTSGIEAEVKMALCDWYAEAKRPPQVLKRLFPKMKLTSIRSQISRGRRTP